MNDIEVRSEFAAVAVSLDESGNGPRLRLRDLNTGSVVLADALLLTALMRAAGDPEALCAALLPVRGH